MGKKHRIKHSFKYEWDTDISSKPAWNTQEETNQKPNKPNSVAEWSICHAIQHLRSHTEGFREFPLLSAGAREQDPDRLTFLF